MWVLNLSIPVEYSVKTLGPLIEAYMRRTALSTPLGTPGPDASDIGQSERGMGELNDEDNHLVGMLRKDYTTTDIARACFCSERSMYRRIRALYDRMGVANRRELQLTLTGGTPPANTRLTVSTALHERLSKGSRTTLTQ